MNKYKGRPAGCPYEFPFLVNNTGRFANRPYEFPLPCRDTMHRVWG